MSFHITLPSNAPNPYSSGNTQANFTTYLENPLNLKGPYEVALVDINFTKNFKVDLGSYKIRDSINNMCI